MYDNQSPFPGATSSPVALSFDAEAAARLAFLRRVYSYFLGGLGVTALGAVVALTNRMMLLWIIDHFWVAVIGSFAAFFLCRAMMGRPGLNLLALAVFTGVEGLLLAPLLWYAIYVAGGSGTIIWSALAISGSAFAGLTAYVFATKKDFSWMGAALSVGLLLVIGSLVSNFFITSAKFDLAISIVGVVLFSGYILFDTSRLLHRHREINPVDGALQLYLDFINLFIFIIRILLSSRR